MNHIASITSTGQLNIPKKILKSLSINGPVKVGVAISGRSLIVTPKVSFWDLAGSMKSEIKLTDAQLRKARESFEKNWSENS